MIRESINLLERIRDDLGQRSIIVGVSGGKDSLVVLDLAIQAFGHENIHGFFLYLIPNLQCEEKFVTGAERRYGISIQRFRHPDMAAYLRFSEGRPVRPETEDRIRRNLRWVDIERIMQSRTGADWRAYGHRVADSLHRRAMIQRHEGVIEKPRRCYPIWDWKPREVFGYLRSKNIPIPPQLGSRPDKTSGVAPMNPKCMLFLRKNYPEDYRRLVEVFPYSELMIERDQVRAKYAIEYNA